MTPNSRIDFIDLQAQRKRIGKSLDDAVLAVVHSGRYIMGPEIGELETKLAAFCGAKHVVSCSNGTDAMVLVLMAYGVGPGDAVFVPSFTFAATAEVVAQLGAAPVFVDCFEDTFNMDPASLVAAIETARRNGLKAKGIIPVDLFGLPADYDAILPIAQANRLWVLADTAQGFGATYKGRVTGSIGNVATTSFFPAKPLGCYGDGGAVFTDDSELAQTLVSLRVHGQGQDKYDNVRIGMNGRLDTLQATILLKKLEIFPDEIVARNAVAKRYCEKLAPYCKVPVVPEGLVSIWAQFTVRVPAAKRGKLAERLKAAGVPTAIYYVKPLHQQLAYKAYPVAMNGLPVSEQLAGEVISLPMHAYLEPAVQDRICAAFVEALA
jgi:dTDP-4-amino-4,6-dideoxygalactose transaminase